MNFVSTHDTVRGLNQLSAVKQPTTREEQVKRVLSKEERKIAEQRLRLAYLFLYFYPGVVSLYYGDEVAAEGFKDPFNRRTMDWSKVCAENQHWQAIQKMSRLRRLYPVLRTGHVAFVVLDKRRFLLRRHLEEGLDAFGQTLSGPAEAYLLLNDTTETWTLLPETFAHLGSEYAGFLTAISVEPIQLPPQAALTIFDTKIEIW